MTRRTEITRDDLMDIGEYGRVRKDRRTLVTELKRHRRMDVGPVATFYFENWDTMWHQIHEMLFIEKGGEAQIEDELRAYNPMIPQGNELVATVMFEIPDKARRHAFLAKLGGVEETMFIQLGDERVTGEPEADVDRTTADGKASSVQFVHFRFSDGQIERFKNGADPVILGVEHENYSHMAVMPRNVREALSEDFA